MAIDLLFTEEEMTIDDGVGYPKAYDKLCRDRGFGPYSHGPPFTFTPYALPQQESLRAKDLDEMFPITNLKAKPTAKPRIFVSLLWKQLNHLGNAGFDPAIFRVDQYGNVLYYHADSASPLAWEIDHWFPCSRGGLTVPSNLRILQWQVCKNKDNKLEFLIPWWDLQVGISVNQFISIFASLNSDFRHRAFSMLFSEGESEELNASQTVDSHSFPQHFIESKEKLGLAPAAIVLSRKESHEASSTLKSLDINRRPRSNFPLVATRKSKSVMSKENENPNMVDNPYQAIVVARDSLKHREETAKIQAELQNLDDEVNELKQKTEEEKLAIQELELVLIKRRRRAEKCRRLAEAQSSYRAMLEKMIRDAMHQSVIYKEQVRLNQAASNALTARLEAQRAICDSSERELHRRFKQRDELEKQIKPEWEQARKRSRMDDSLIEERNEKTVLHLPETKPVDDILWAEKDHKAVLYLPGTKSRTPLHKELRVFLEEEQKASETGLLLNEEGEKETLNTKAIVAAEYENPIEDKLGKLKIEEEGKIYNLQFSVLREPEIEDDEESRKQRGKGNVEGDKRYNLEFPVFREPKIEEDEESRKQRGKGNVEKWLQMLLGNTEEGTDLNPSNADENEISKTDEIIRKLNLIYPQKEKKILRFPESQDTEDGRNTLLNNLQMVPEKEFRAGKEEIVEIDDENKFLLKNPPYRLVSEQSNANEVDFVGKGVGSSSSFEGKERREKSGKERGLVRSESARAFPRIPSSPSVILGMRKGVDCIGKKPLVIDDDDDDDHAAGNNFIKSSVKTIKRAVKI